MEFQYAMIGRLREYGVCLGALQGARTELVKFAIPKHENTTPRSGGRGAIVYVHHRRAYVYLGNSQALLGALQGAQDTYAL